MKRLFTWLNNQNLRFWERIVSSTAMDERSLSSFRIITGAFLLVLNFTSFSWIGQAPQAFFQPPVSMAIFSNGFPSKTFFLLLDILSLTALVAFTLGIKARLFLLVYIFLNLIGTSWQYSFGKIDHPILLYAMLFCLSWSGWGSQLALVPDKAAKPGYREKSLSLLSVLVCFAFFSAGFDKLLNWINTNFSSSGTAFWFYSGYYNLGRIYLLANRCIYLPFWIFKCMDFFAVTFELSTIFFLLRSGKAWKGWLLMAALFHIINTFLLNIPFLLNAIVYLAFCDFSWLYMTIERLRSKMLFKVLIALSFALVIIARVYDILTFTFSPTIFIPASMTKANLYVSLAFWMLTMVKIYRDYSRSAEGAAQKRKLSLFAY